MSEAVQLKLIEAAVSITVALCGLVAGGFGLLMVYLKVRDTAAAAATAAKQLEEQARKDAAIAKTHNDEHTAKLDVLVDHVAEIKDALPTLVKADANASPEKVAVVEVTPEAAKAIKEAV
jgi:hypothetical protein